MPLRSVANALLSANNTTDLSQLQQINVSLSPGQNGAPAFPNILTSVVPTTTLVNFTTIDPHLRNAHSDQASVEIERKLGATAVISAGYDYLRGRDLIAQVNQNVPSCTASGASWTRFTTTTPSSRQVGQLPHQLHPVEGNEQRRRELLQLAHRSVRHQ